MFAQIRNFMEKPQSITNSLLVDGVNYVGSDIPDAWATYYESPSDDPSFDSEHRCQVLDEFLCYNANSDSSSFTPFTVCEVQEATCSLPRYKAPGPDGIDSEHLIFGGTALSDHLAALFNTHLTLRYLPLVTRFRFPKVQIKTSEFPLTIVAYSSCPIYRKYLKS